MTYCDFIDRLKIRMLGSDHNIILIKGRPGRGKSTIALHIYRSLAKRLDRPIDLNHVFYRSYQTAALLQDRRKRQIYIFDEGGNVAFNRTSMTEEQIELAQVLLTIRQRLHTLIWCAPNTDRLDGVVRDDLADFRVLAEHKGHGVIQSYGENLRRGTNWWQNIVDPFNWTPFSDKEPNLWAGYEDRKEQAYFQQADSFGANPEMAEDDYKELRGQYLRRRKIKKMMRSMRLPPTTPIQSPPDPP